MEIPLPPPLRGAGPGLHDLLRARRSRRRFAPDPLPLEIAADLLFATQGVTSHDGKRAAPSAGATFPLETYLVAGAVTGLDPGVFRYLPPSHRLVRVREGDVRAALAEASLKQSFLAVAPLTVALAADYARTVRRYGDRSNRYVPMDAGHAAENFLLVAEAL
ncbi:MAG: SagB/ThcOx family dehydrogenase, partial [Planctomycetes bacterium]|nr:SagB/ThcOx family dehydrogenase [Planctomycetota bacterium]